MSLEGKTAVITGASSGIGWALAKALFKEGAALVLLGRDSKRLAALEQEVGRADLHAFDLNDDAAVHAFAREVTADILVHSAGVATIGAFAESPVADLDRHYRLNVRAPFLLTQAMLPGLLERQGQVVFVNSGAGLNARAKWGQYAASKHALKALADSLRDEHGKQLRVISVYPGRTATPMQARVRELEGAPYEPHTLVQPQDVAGLIVHALAMPRSAVVSDVSVRPV